MPQHEKDLRPCRRLRSKNFYFLERAPRSAADLMDGSGRVWCQRTMDSLGPDGKLVDPEDCRPGRRCYEIHSPRA